MTRYQDVNNFYRILNKLENKIGKKHLLSNCTGKMNWPERGVYFFYEPDELRENEDLRVVRIGTHALKTGSKTTLWNRLRQHRGNVGGSRPGGGNHRGSVFRLHVGTAIISKEKLDISTWSIGSSAKFDVRDKEYTTECLVSNHICSMPFLWINVDDFPGTDSQRGYIERNVIGLLSNFKRDEAIDPPNSNWLGKYAWSKKIRLSGLWNVNHVDEDYDPAFIDILGKYVEEMK